MARLSREIDGRKPSAAERKRRDADTRARALRSLITMRRGDRRLPVARLNKAERELAREARELLKLADRLVHVATRLLAIRAR